MARITFLAGDDIPHFIGPEQFETSGAYDGVPPDERGTERGGDGAIRVLLPRVADRAAAFRSRAGSQRRGEAHAHYEHEILVVTQGQLLFGSIVCDAGSAVSIPGMTLYSFKTGPDGAQFLNFRPVGGFARLSKERLLQIRSEMKASERDER